MTVETIPAPAGADEARPDPGDSGIRGRLLDALDDRVNPIVVKEVRQALRGKFFTVIFALTLLIATIIGAMQLVGEAQFVSSDSGQDFYQSIFFCLSVAVCLFVPFAAFLSLSSEWDEETHDMLVISNLRPWQIVRGKWLGSFLQSLLFGVTFLPFLAFAFLLRGLDLAAAVWGAVLALATSAGLVAVALALSSSSQKKVVRVFLMALLAIFLTYVSFGLAAFTSFALLDGRMHSGPNGAAGLWAYLSIVLVVAGFAQASAAAKLTHPEENRSTATRLLGTATLLVGLGWSAWFYLQARDTEALFVPAVAGAIWITSMGLNFLSEEEALGRRVRLEVPRNRLLALLAAPWFPGGGRAVLYHLVHAVLLVGFLLGFALVFPPASAVAPALASSGTGTPVFQPDTWKHLEPGFGALILLSFGFLYTGLPTALVARRTQDPFWRSAARVLALLLALLGLFGPAILGLLLNVPELRDMRHPGNPIWVIEQVLEDDEYWIGVALLGVAGAVLLLNVPRMVSGLRAMPAASSYRLSVERRLRERDAGGDEPDAAPAS